MYICLNGKIVRKENAKIQACDHGFLYGDGVYETLRTVKGKVWLLSEHLKRLRKSAQEVGIKIPWSNQGISRLVERLCEKNGHKEYRIRITISRGCNDFDFTTCKKPTLVIEAAKLKLPPKKIYLNGVSVITYKIERSKPLIKSTSMLSSILARRQAKKRKAYEALLINHKGNITEGSLTNVFVVDKGNLITPKDGILEGTVRNFLIKILERETPVKLTNIPHKKLYDFDEVFITSSIKGVVPVVKIDGKRIGKGKIGPVTKEVMKLLKNKLNGTKKSR